MKFPIPPWYKPLNEKLKGAEWLVNATLVVIIALCIILLLRGDRLTKTAFLVYLVSP
jgi:hypothetical protein